MQSFILSILALAGCLATVQVQAQTCIVRDGSPNAAIVIAENPPRMAALAALELQYYLEKISGARLPIAHAPQPGAVSLFVGRSRFTDERGISDEKLPSGAFRMVSGPDWLALVGHDRDFLPPEPFQKNLSREEARERWDAMTAAVTDSKWVGPPMAADLWNPRGHFRGIMSERYGEEHVELLMTDRAPDWPGIGISRWDLGGSLNAVCRYLMDLGVRWYMPGDLGEVVPEKKTIALPAVNATVHPDYALRTFNWAGYHIQPFDNIIWARRVGMFSASEVWPYTWAHALARVYSRPEMQAAHPEYFALRGGERDTGKRGSKHGNVCYSSDGLIRETVDYARFVFDRFDLPTMDLWPEDGYRHCNCDLCRDKSPSEVVWGFVDRVARELYKTHPDRLVTCAAYTPYTDPPDNIDRFPPNVGVMLAAVGPDRRTVRPQLDRPEPFASFLSYVRSWQDKLAPGRILRWQNSFYNSATPLSFPVVHPRAIAAELKALKGLSKGEFHNWQMKSVFHNPGNSHLTLYALAQYLWDADWDIDAFLEEYYTLFYGPARDEMKVALEYAQASYPRDHSGVANVETGVKIRFVELLDKARASAGATVYGERIQLLMDELPSLEQLRQQAHDEANAPDPRENAPLLVGQDGPGPEGVTVHRLKDLVSGEDPEIATTFRAWWHDAVLHIDFHCQEPDMEHLFASGLVYDGDSVVMVIETPAFSYYHIEISPEGKVYERAVNPSPGMGDWSAQAEVETERGADYWRVRVRLPVSGAAGLETDANHLIAGDKPTGENPWWVNFGRSRVRGADTSNSAFNPTGRGSYHVPDKFARFVIR